MLLITDVEAIKAPSTEPLCPHRIPELPSIRCQLKRAHKEEFHHHVDEETEITFKWKMTPASARSPRPKILTDKPPGNSLGTGVTHGEMLHYYGMFGV